MTDKARRHKQPEINTIDDVLFLEQNRPFISVLNKFELQMGKPWWRVAFAKTEKILLVRLDELVRIMRVNPIWKARLDSVGVSSIKSWGDWHKIPIANRADLNKLYTKSKDGLVIPWNYNGDPGGHKGIASGGSTSEPIMTVYRFREITDAGKRTGKFWKDVVLDRDHRVTILSLWHNQNGWGGDELSSSIHEGIPGANVFPAGGITQSREIDFFLNQKVTDIHGLPTDLHHLVQLIRKDLSGKIYPHVRRVLYGGEFIDPIVIDGLRHTFPNSKLVSVYGSTQAMQIAMEAGDGQGYLRVNDDVNLLEIVDCDGKLLPYGQRGRIVVTRLMGNGDQPLRLDLQDEGVLELPHVNDPLQARKFKIFGRAGTYLRIATWDIRVEDILTTTGSKLTKIIPTDEILGRQLILDEESVILRVAVKDKNKLSVPSLQSQYDLMRDAIVEARDMTFFDDPQDFPRSLKLAIELVDLETLQKTSSGKTASFVNRRGKNKTS